MKVHSEQEYALASVRAAREVVDQRRAALHDAEEGLRAEMIYAAQKRVPVRTIGAAANISKSVVAEKVRP